MNKKVKTGGVERKAFHKDNILPVIFTKEPFNDASFQLDQIDRSIREGEISEFIIMMRSKDHGIKYVWRGENPLSSLLGMIEYVKMLIQRDFVD